MLIQKLMINEFQLSWVFAFLIKSNFEIDKTIEIIKGSRALPSVITHMFMAFYSIIHHSGSYEEVEIIKAFIKRNKRIMKFFHHYAKWKEVHLEFMKINISELNRIYMNSEEMKNPTINYENSFNFIASELKNKERNYHRFRPKSEDPSIKDQKGEYLEEESISEDFEEQKEMQICRNDQNYISYNPKFTVCYPKS